ncbi:MAG: hypothetical protein WED07_03460 [Candidatus Freyarchaeum deiterrae]
MSKKAAEVVEAAPKFKQPWQGFLSFMSIFIIAYLTYEFLLHPVWGLLTHMIQTNVFTAFWLGEHFGGSLGGEIGLTLAINNAQEMALYPMGYIVDWVSYFIFCIVWIVAIIVLCRSFSPTPPKQPWFGIYVTALSMILAFVTWFILGFKLGWTGYDMIVLGTTGFVVFPIWGTLFMYWPFVPKHAQAHPVWRGAVFVTISWIITFIVRWAVMKIIYANPIGVFFEQYLGGNLTQPLFATYPYDFIVSGLFAVIVGFNIMSQLAFFPNMSQPWRGLINAIIGIIIGVIMWIILGAIVTKSSAGVVMSTPSTWLLTTPYSNYGNVTAYLTFPLVILLAGELTFANWPWTRFGKWSHLIFIIMAFIIGSILYYIIMVNPGYAAAITGTNLIPSMSGMQTMYMVFYFAPGAFGGYTAFMVFLIAFQGVAQSVGYTIMFSWMVTVLIFYILAYEAMGHWPWA